MEGAWGTRWGADEGEGPWYEKFAVKVSKGERFSGKSAKDAWSKKDIKMYESFVQMRIFTYHLERKVLNPC